MKNKQEKWIAVVASIMLTVPTSWADSEMNDSDNISWSSSNRQLINIEHDEGFSNENNVSYFDAFAEMSNRSLETDINIVKYVHSLSEAEMDRQNIDYEDFLEQGKQRFQQWFNRPELDTISRTKVGFYLADFLQSVYEPEDGDDEQARALLEMVVRQEIFDLPLQAKAAYNLANMAEHGVGGQIDSMRARELYIALVSVQQRLTPTDRASGLYFLADMLYQGHGGEVDFYNAKKLYEDSIINQNLSSYWRAESVLKLAHMYHLGEGVAKNTPQAIRILQTDFDIQNLGEENISRFRETAQAYYQNLQLS